MLNVMKNITTNSKLKIILFGTSLALLEQTSFAAVDPIDQIAVKKMNDTIQRQQQRDETLEKRIEPTPIVQSNLDKQLLIQSDLQYLKSNSEEICFNIKKFILIGDDARHFSFALSSITNGGNNIIGRCIGVLGLNQALDLVQNKIISRGYVTTRILLPQQNIASGEIQLQVIAGKVDQIKFATGTSKRAHKFNALPVKSGDFLNIRDIEQGLENFKRVPTVEADFKIKPSEQHNIPGYSDLELAWHQSKPYRLHLGVDDAGADSTGKYQGTATLSLDNLFTANDLFYGSYNHDLGGGDSGKRGTDGFYLSYSIPYKYWLLSTSYSQSDYNQTVAGAEEIYEYSGKSKLVSADLSHVLYRAANRKTTASVGGWFRESQNFINDTEVKVQHRKTSGWKASLDHTEYFAAATLSSNITYKKGTGAFNAMYAPEEEFGEAYTRVGIAQVNASLQVPFQVGKQNLKYLAEWRMQHSKKPLTTQDRFSIGNRYTVRGYDGEQTLMADNGFLVRNEMSGTVPKLPMQWYSGIDYGEVGGKTARTPNPLVGTSLLGAVVGLRGQVLKSISYDAFVGTPIKKPKYYQTDSLTTGFSLNWMY